MIAKSLENGIVSGTISVIIIFISSSGIELLIAGRSDDILLDLLLLDEPTAVAIFSVGVGLFLGKLNWGIAAATAAGVGIIFSAPQLVSWLAGDNADDQCIDGDT